MATWLIVLLVVVFAILLHFSGVVFGPWWKRWALKVVGFPKEAVEFFMRFLRASTDFKWTAEEKAQMKKEFADMLEALTPPALKEG